MTTTKKKAKSARRRAQRTAASLNAWAEAFHKNSVKHGFWDKYPDLASRISSIPEKIALIHSEASEALEDYRNFGEHLDFRTLHYDTSMKPIGFASELADIVIRTMELANALGIDIGRAIAEKHAYNKTRPFKHGGKKI